MELSKQEYWNELLFPIPGNLLYSEIELVSPELAGGFFTTEPPGAQRFSSVQLLNLYSLDVLLFLLGTSLFHVQF